VTPHRASLNRTVGIIAAALGSTLSLCADPDEMPAPLPPVRTLPKASRSYGDFGRARAHSTLG